MTSQRFRLGTSRWRNSLSFSALLSTFVIGCAARGEDPSKIDSLRVVTITADPYLSEPGTAIDMVVYTADPAKKDFDLLIWTCSLSSTTLCAESQLPALSDWAAVISAEETSRETKLGWSLPALNNADELVIEGGIAVPLWVLACEPGLCPIIEQVSAELEGGGPASLSTTLALVDPLEWLSSLPMSRSALGRKVLTRADGGIHTGVGFLYVEAHFSAADADPMVLNAGDVLKLSLATESADTDPSNFTRVFTTIGMANPAYLYTEDEPIQATLELPEAGGEGEVFVVSMPTEILFGPIGAWSSGIVAE